MYIQLDFIDLGFALGMMAIAIILSFWQKLGLEGQLALASARTIVQLLVVGSVLEVIFQWQNPVAVVAIVMVMLTIAAIVARNRIGNKIPQVLLMIWGSILTATVLTMTYVNLLVFRSSETWFEPQYIIPLTGMVLGNAMNAAAISGERLATSLNNHQLEIETHLCLGATPAQAIAQYRQEAIKAGLIPTLNAMMVVGIVTLPGMITGQMLAGADPLDAAAYQILIMFMLGFATLLTALLVTRGIWQQFFNAAAQLQKF